MNIYEKMAVAKKELKETSLKKSGTMQNRKPYFELVDFLPAIIDLQVKHKILCYPDFSGGSAVLHIVNAENPEEQYSVSAPFGSASLHGCHEIQNIGAVETYHRRYLYMAAFDIVESDVLDGEQTEQDAPNKKTKANKGFVCHNCGMVVDKDIKCTDGSLIKLSDFQTRYKGLCPDCVMLKQSQNHE